MIFLMQCAIELRAFVKAKKIANHRYKSCIEMKILIHARKIDFVSLFLIYLTYWTKDKLKLNYFYFRRKSKKLSRWQQRFMLLSLLVRRAKRLVNSSTLYKQHLIFGLGTLEYRINGGGENNRGVGNGSI